jgi:zinc/manganese transport system substrate-binding protein
MLDIARQSGVPVVGVTETEPAGTTIETWFAGEIAAIAAALGPKP